MIPKVAPCGSRRTPRRPTLGTSIGSMSAEPPSTNGFSRGREAAEAAVLRELPIARCRTIAVVAYDEELAARMRELVAGESGVTEQKMFGGLAFLIGGNMAVAASERSEERRVGKECRSR